MKLAVIPSRSIEFLKNILELIIADDFRQRFHLAIQSTYHFHDFPDFRDFPEFRGFRQKPSQISNNTIETDLNPEKYFETNHCGWFLTNFSFGDPAYI